MFEYSKPSNFLYLLTPPKPAFLCSSGIGLAMTKVLLKKGYFVTGISKTAGSQTIKSEKFKMVNLDLSQLDSLSDELEKIVSSIDIPIRALINNSGIGKFGSVEQLSVSDMRLVMETNFLSHAIVTKVFLPILKRVINLFIIKFSCLIDLVVFKRIISSDPNPNGPGIIEEDLSKQINPINFIAKHQPFFSGSSVFSNKELEIKFRTVVSREWMGIS